MATACFFEVTFLPLPDFNFPSFISCIVSSTFSDAFFEYFAITIFLSSCLHVTQLTSSSVERCGDKDGLKK